MPDPPDAPHIYELDPLADARWVEFVKKHPRASVFHTPSWLRALRLTYGYQPVALTTNAPGEPLTTGLVSCRVSSWLTGKRIVSLPFSDHCEPLVDRREDLEAMLGHLRRMGANRYVELRPVLAKPCISTEFSMSDSYFLHIVDLSRSPEALFRTFHRDSVQRKIRRAEREALRYESGNSRDLLEKFYRMLVMTRRRQHIPPQPISWFHNLNRSFGSALQVRLASTREGLPVAGILTLKHGAAITYKYGCSDARFSNLGGTALLFWRTIQEASQEGFVELDLGRSAVGNQGLIVFKEHWGARRVGLEYWRFPAGRKSGGNTWKSDLRKHLVGIAPDWCLVAAGRLLYPHIG